jgi:hypothetical protein
MKSQSLFTYLAFFVLLACGSNSIQSKSIEKCVKSTSVSYDQYLIELQNEKSQIDTNDWKRANALLFHTINENIPSYWAGTKWDFNGTTQQPGLGNIACGYFLTTTMQQTGYDIKRVWMAQQASSILIKAYCKEIKVMNSLSSVKEYLKLQPDSTCFIIGLDFHTGFVTKGSDSSFLIHSNYINSQGVIKEDISNAEVLLTNTYFMIGSLTAHKERLKTWMNW